MVAYQRDLRNYACPIQKGVWHSDRHKGWAGGLKDLKLCVCVCVCVYCVCVCVRVCVCVCVCVFVSNCMWHHETFLVQEHWHLAIHLYCCCIAYCLLHCEEWWLLCVSEYWFWSWGATKWETSQRACCTSHRQRSGHGGSLSPCHCQCVRLSFFQCFCLPAYLSLFSDGRYVAEGLSIVTSLKYYCLVNLMCWHCLEDLWSFC